ncbi:hypothetical protein [Bizionia sp.]
MNLTNFLFKRLTKESIEDNYGAISDFKAESLSEDNEFKSKVN